jgi:hypothetical protein
MSGRPFRSPARHTGGPCHDARGRPPITRHPFAAEEVRPRPSLGPAAPFDTRRRTRCGPTIAQPSRPPRRRRCRSPAPPRRRGRSGSGGANPAALAGSAPRRLVADDRGRAPPWKRGGAGVGGGARPAGPIAAPGDCPSPGSVSAPGDRRGAAPETRPRSRPRQTARSASSAEPTLTSKMAQRTPPSPDGRGPDGTQGQACPNVREAPPGPLRPAPARCLGTPPTGRRVHQTRRGRLPYRDPCWISQ